MKIHYIVVGILAFFGILIFMQMIFPFPYGIIGGLAIAIMVLITCIKKATRYGSKQLPTRKPDDTMFYGCPRCGNNTQVISGRQYCSICKIYL